MFTACFKNPVIAKQLNRKQQGRSHAIYEIDSKAEKISLESNNNIELTPLLWCIFYH